MAKTAPDTFTCKLDEVGIADWPPLALKLGINGLFHSLKNGQRLVKTLVLWARKLLPDTKQLIAAVSMDVNTSLVPDRVALCSTS